MIMEIPDDNSIIKWKYNDNDAWKIAEISDLIKAYEERPKGKWIKNETRSNECQCTECGNYDLSYFPYCHWCGADMRGEKK